MIHMQDYCHLFSRVVDGFLQGGNPLKPTLMTVGLELVHLSPKCKTRENEKKMLVEENLLVCVKEESVRLLLDGGESGRGGLGGSCLHSATGAQWNHTSHLWRFCFVTVIITVFFAEKTILSASHGFVCFVKCCTSFSLELE